MKRFFVILTVSVLFSAAFVAENKTGASFNLKKEKGSLYELIETAAKNQFAKDSNLFRPPTKDEQKSWQKIVENVLQNRLAEADRDLKKLAVSYELVLFTDETTKREYVVLQEKTAKTGWGFFAFDLAAKNSLTVEVTHPVADARTELEGVDAFLQTRAQAFLMAGTHRRANKKETLCSQPNSANNADAEATDYPESDVAHNSQTIFQTTHETLVNQKPKTVAVQMHGMIERKVCPNVFMSSGTKKLTSNTSKLLACLTKQKVEAGIYEANAEACPLGAQTNVQGRFSNGEKRDPCNTNAKDAPEPGSFIHIEQEPNIRRDKKSWQPVIEALKCAFP
jgi:hypothetical protein